MTKNIRLTPYEQAIFRSLIDFTKTYPDNKGLGIIMLKERLLGVLTFDLFPADDAFIRDHSGDYFPDIVGDELKEYSHMYDGAIVTNRRGQVIAAHRCVREARPELIERERGFGTKRHFLASVSLYPDTSSFAYSVDARSVYVFKDGKIARKYTLRHHI